MSRPSRWETPVSWRLRLASVGQYLALLAVAYYATGALGIVANPNRLYWTMTLWYTFLLYRRMLLLSLWARRTMSYVRDRNPTPPIHDVTPLSTQFIVLLPAYRASAIIRQTLASIAAQDYPADRFIVVVITESEEPSLPEQQTTSAIVSESIADMTNVIHLSRPREGYKAGALNYAYRTLGTMGLIHERSQFVIIDADSQLAYDALSTIDENIRDSQTTDVIRQLIVAPVANYNSANLFTKFVSMADAVGAIGKWARNVRQQRRSDLTAGSGIVVPARLCHYLDRTYGQPWDTNVITEDSRLIIGHYSLLHGIKMKTKAVPTVLIEASPCGDTLLETYITFWRQRVRWATGGYDELKRLITARPSELYIDVPSFAQYHPSLSERARTHFRRAALLLSWITDHFWWGIGTILAPFLWWTRSHAGAPFSWAWIIAVVAAVLFIPLYTQWCFTAFLKLGCKHSASTAVALYWLSFPFVLLYVLPIVYVQVMCLLGRRKVFQTWQPTTYRFGSPEDRVLPRSLKMPPAQLQSTKLNV